MNQVTHFDPLTVGAAVGPKGHAVPSSDKPKGDGHTQNSFWEMRTQEQPYAFLSDRHNKKENRYGQRIDLLEINPAWEAGQPLYINGNAIVGSNPNRNKQHGFFFTADNCIGCHACEAACSEKNDNPGHIAFRSVGYVEGGCYPDYKRLNISMACNHCDDPVCLKGCPTNAYTKHTEYGAVLQDPETCFGCGYCTWVCPYNAPQLDPLQGQVSKCNMCVDRLEVGLKPACVSACLGNALDFGVIENIPENRVEAKTAIPGFPDPGITHPNIRFQQTRTLAEEMTRTDSAPVKYHRDGAGHYRPVVDAKEGLARQWNLKKLSSRENPLVLFTLLSQTAIGAFAVLFAGAQVGVEELKVFHQGSAYAPLVLFNAFFVALGLFFSTTHLGKPLRFYRGFNNLKYSPVCREGLGLALFIVFAGLHGVCSLPANAVFTAGLETLAGWRVEANATAALAADVSGLLALVGGSGGLYYMVKCYRIKARPFWDHWNVATDFTGTAFSLGAYLAGSVMLAARFPDGGDVQGLHAVVRALMATGLALMLTGMAAHKRAMANAAHEGAASWYIQSTVFGRTQALRMALLWLNFLLSTALVFIPLSPLGLILAWLLTGFALLASHLAGRALFYVLVVPTTMPGAFFWKNKAFEQHARDIGLAEMPQVGLAAGH